MSEFKQQGGSGTLRKNRFIPYLLSAVIVVDGGWLLYRYVVSNGASAQQNMAIHSPGWPDTPSVQQGRLASFYRRPLDAARVRQRLVPPFGYSTPIEAPEALERKTGLADWREDDWSSLPPLAVAFLAKPNTPFIHRPHFVPKTVLAQGLHQHQKKGGRAVMVSVLPC